MSKPLVSLCIPTNGIVEWVLPVLESIYNQNISDDLFEVIITDNGDQSELEINIKNYLEKHLNLLYYKTNDFQFLNQISCFKKANGELIKFVNHRMVLKEGSLDLLINICNENIDKKTVLYFLNGSKKMPNFNYYCDFNSFVKALSYFSSWSGGLAIWKSDLELITKETEYNKWFPHTNFLFSVTENRNFLICNQVIQEEQNADDTKKGKYNLFEVFAIEYLEVILNLVKQKKITYETFLYVKKDLFKFICDLYLNYVILKKACSYEILYYDEAISVFYGKCGLVRLKIKITFLILKKCIRKMLNIFHIIH